MTAGILTVNAGSSSIKVGLFAADGGGTDLKRLWSGQAENLVAGSGAQAPTHEQALSRILDQVRAQARDAAGGVEVVAVGHRIVHGGSVFDAPVRIDAAVESAIEALAPLAPLHQPHNLAGIRAVRAAFPALAQVACFDTAFHRTQPEVHQRFALPRRWHDAGVRRYGFHGLSYESVLGQLVAREPALARGRLVVAHLGNGASMCALDAGRSVATSMSFSPLDGLTMGTRCGRIDGAAVLHLQQHHGLTAEAVGTLLHRESGLLGLSGLSGDMRTLSASDAPAARLAIDHFVESVLRELAGLAAALRGVDTLVFTGGIGENAVEIRQRICEEAAWLGLRLDAAANAAGATRIDADGSAVRLRVLRTDEEAVIAGHTARATQA